VRRIEDHALLGDTQTAALVTTEGSVDWLCLPRFDSPACFAALLGDESHGHWRLAPAGPVRRVRRRYRDETLVLETDFETDSGTVRVVDCMPVRDGNPTVVRVVEGLHGRTTMDMELVVRFEYGSTTPWVRRVDDRLRAVAGPNALYLDTPVATEGRDLTTVARFEVDEGQQVPFVLTWCASHETPPEPIEVVRAIKSTECWWRDWIAQCDLDDGRERVIRSLITLKALTYSPTGGMVAAPTTSLPELAGGVRNWDYRYCWVRDATFTYYALLGAGFRADAECWRDWLMRAVAGDPAHMPVVYRVDGERLLSETEVPWLPGCCNSAPVRIGNAAHGQRQLDVFGELVDAMYLSRGSGAPADEHGWELQRTMLDHFETAWNEPDEGIWEIRGGAQHHTHSKVMAWVAFDRAIRTIEEFGAEGPLDRWRDLRQRIHDEVCEKAWDPQRWAFTQSYGSPALDASVLRMPLVGFLPAGDERMQDTIRTITTELGSDGLLYRFSALPDDAEYSGEEGAFLPCSFWLADDLALLGRQGEAQAVFDRASGLPNDVGLLSEEYDPATHRMLGNFPQALTHVSLVNSAINLARRRRTSAPPRTALSSAATAAATTQPRFRLNHNAGLASWATRSKPPCGPGSWGTGAQRFAGADGSRSSSVCWASNPVWPR